MSAILRAYGMSFDVDAFLVGCSLPVCEVKRRGEPVYPASQPHGRRHEWSGVHVVASEADFHEFRQQVEDSIAFLTQKSSQLQRLCEWTGVESVTLDFGIERRNVLLQCDILPAELIRLAGALGLEIEISQYPAVENAAQRESDDFTRN